MLAAAVENGVDENEEEFGDDEMENLDLMEGIDE